MAMQRFKKHLRLLVESFGGEIGYGHDDSLRVKFPAGQATFSPLSYDAMHCEIDAGDGVFPVRASKIYVFDIVDRLASPYFAPRLRQYQPGELITLEHYIEEEMGEIGLADLRDRLAVDPSLTQASIDGNRILVAYYRGVLILRDDLCLSATNVVDCA